MTVTVIGFGLGAIAVMLLVEEYVSYRQERRSEQLATIVTGLLGMAFFVAMLYAAGAM
jgi:hypothetical protein